MIENNSKLILLTFFIVSIFSVGLIIFTFNKNIKFISNPDKGSRLGSFMDLIYEDEGFLAYLQKKKQDDSYYINDKLIDTDGDGLSDFDEENIFFTSKYLVDSDGDGISDFLEIKMGSDPNCPTGSSCDVYNKKTLENDLNYSSEQIRFLLNEAVGEDYSDIFEALTDEQIMNLFNNSYTKTQELFSSISGSLGNLDIKDFLKKDENNGINLENTINSNINNNLDNINIFLDAISDLNFEQIQVISNMEVLEIRNLFIDSGIFTKDFMDSFTDFEIKESLNVL